MPTSGVLGNTYAQLGGFVLAGLDTDSATAAPETTGVDVRLYSSTGLRRFLPDISKVDFEVLGRGGYGRGSLEIVIAWEDFVLDGTERLDVWIDAAFIYRGYCRIPHRHITGSGETAAPEFWGLSQQAGKYRCKRKYAYGAPVDISVVARDIIADEVTIAGRLSSVVTDIQTVGVLIQEYDARGKTAQQALDGLCDYAPNDAIWGFDVDSTSPIPLDRIYFRPMPTAISYRPSFGKEITDFNYSEDTTQIVNTLHLIGGAVKHPNLLHNPSFEEVAPNSETVNNLLTDYSFEDNDPAWTISGTRKHTPGDYPGVGRTGQYWLECDTAGEKGEQTVTGIDYLTVYTASVWARRENAANANTFTFEVEGLTSGGTIVHTVTIENAVDPATSEYTRYHGDVDFSAYPTVTKARVRMKSNAGTASNDGIDFEDVGFYVKDGTGQDGWLARAVGSATISSIDWAVRSFPVSDTQPWHGGYGIAVTPTGAGSGSDYVEIYKSREHRVSLTPNTAYYIMVYVRGKDLVDLPSISVGVVEYQSDGTSITQTSESPIMTPAAYNGWHRHGVAFTTASATAQGQAFIRIRANVLHYLDASMLVIGEMPDNLDIGLYWPEGTLEWSVDTDSPYLTLSADADASIADYGVQGGEETISAVNDAATAQAAASSYFNAHAIPRIEGPLTVYDPSPIIKPDGLVRILHLDLPPPAAFPSRVHTSIDGGGAIVQVIDTGHEVPELVDVMNLVVKRGPV